MGRTLSMECTRGGYFPCSVAAGKKEVAQRHLNARIEHEVI